MRRLLILFALVSACAAQTTVTGTIVDPNGNAYANGTASAYTVAASGQPTVSISPVTTNGAGFFTMTLPTGTYVFTMCAPPFNLGPTSNPTPTQICFPSSPIAISGGSQDVTAQLNAVAKVIGPARVGGIGDPGSNGILKRTALNVTAVAGSADILGLWSGTCSLTTFLRGDGSCQTPAGGGNVSTTPGGSQPIVQPLGTNFTVNNLANSRYAPAYNWTVSPAGTLTAATLATITLTPCPLGVNGSDTNLGIYIAGTGVPEALFITGGSCTGGAASGTIQFTPANSHGAGFTIQSGTSGVREAYEDNGKNNQVINLAPSPSNGGGVVNPIIMYTPMIFDTLSNVLVNCNNAVVETYGPTNTRTAFALVGTAQNGYTFRDCRPAANGTVNATTVTNTACSSNVSTITSTLNPPAGSWVDVEWTFDPHYWGIHQVVTTGGSSWTYTDNNCNGGIAPGGASIASQATAGFTSYEYSFVEDDSQGARFEDIVWSQPGTISGRLNNGYVIFADEAAVISGNHGGLSFSCGTINYCGSWVYMPGPFNGSNQPSNNNSSLAHFLNDDISLNCTANGVTSYSGNTLIWEGGVLQGQPMWALNGGVQRGGFGSGEIHQMYVESGNCTAPFYGPNTTSGPKTGVQWYGQSLWISGGEGPQGSNGDITTGVPSFGSGGGTTYYYSLVVKDSVNGTSAPILIGSCAPSGTTCTVLFNRAIDSSGTTTYDLLRQTDAFDAPSTTRCTGGSTSACGSVATAIAQCTGLQCSVTDNVTLNTSSYTTTAGYVPAFVFLSGNIVLQGGAILDCFALNVSSANCATTIATNGYGPINTDASTLRIRPVYNKLNSLTGGFSAGTTDGGSVSALLLENTTQSANYISKGRISFSVGNPPSFDSGASMSAGSDVITLGDCNPLKTFTHPKERPLLDNCDAGIGFDTGNGLTSANWGMHLAAASSISNYINTARDGSSWLERLTSSAKTFKVPVTLGNILGSTQCLHVNSSGVISGTSADCGVTGTPATFYAVNLTGGSTTGGIQEAITAAAAVTGTAVLPNGTTTACGVTVPTNTTVVGYGVSMSTVQCATAGTAVFTVTGSGVEMSGFTAKHITNTPTSGGNGITVNGGAARVRLHDLKTNFNFDGLNLGWTTYGEVTNVISEFNQNDGVKFVPDSTNKTNQWEVKGTLSEQNLLNGFELSLPAGFTNVQATCPHFSGWTQTFGNVGNGWKLSGSAATTSGIADCFFSGTFASQNNASGYLLDLGTNGGRNAILSGVYSEQAGTFTGTAGFAQASQSATNVGYGIEITAACDSTFSPQITSGGMWANSFSGIITACPETVITGVSTFKNGVAGSGSAFNRAGISVRATNVQVSGGTHKDSGGNETAGIEVSNSADTPHINDFVCDSSISTCIVATTQPSNGFQTILGQARLVTTPNTLTVQGTSAIATGSASSTDLAGQLTLSGGTIARSFTGTYVSAPICTATDTTAANAVRVTVTNTTLTITGTGTDVIDYLCIGRN